MPALSTSSIRSPKRPGLGRNAGSWYQYYAGYSSEFVVDVLRELRLPSDATVLDPWNGSGTTTLIARHCGYTALGYDINPALALVAKARLLGQEVLDSLPALTDALLDQPQRQEAIADDDPLTLWFTKDTALRLRTLERGTFRFFVSSTDDCLFAARPSLADVSSLAAFFYVTLFKLIRSELRAFGTTNPTWIKKTRPAQNPVALSWPDINARFRDAQAQLANHLRSLSPAGPQTWRGRAVIDVGHSDALRVPTGSVDAIVSSPPYCTRIDYAVATSPELSTIGFSTSQLRALRESMIGTPTVSAVKSSENLVWGDTCLTFLAAVRRHLSKASATYYTRHYVQYFTSLYASLIELSRVLKPAGRCVLVVQDSFYKDVHLDLAAIVREMAASLHWSHLFRLDFPVHRTKAAVHPGTRRYRSHFGATETVLGFTRNGDR
jgi:tRNA G10  N-methylase Trm11